MQGAIPIGELALCGGGLALALFLRGDAEVEGDGYAHTCRSAEEEKQVIS